MTIEEEQRVLEIMTNYSDLERPMTMNDLCDTVQLFLEGQTEERKIKLRFKNCRSGRRPCENVSNRYINSLNFTKEIKELAERYCTCNAEYRTSHFAKIEKLICRQ